MAKKRDGTPQAQNGPKADKLWRQALLLEVHALAADKKTNRLRLVARAVIQQAMKGDIAAAKEIGDRLDGKSVAIHQVAGEGGGPIQVEDTGTEKVLDAAMLLVKAAARSKPAAT